jgi:hypothetical protein
VDLNVRSGHPNLLDQQAHEPLTLLEVDGVDALLDPVGERFDLVRQSVFHCEFPPLVQQRLPLLLELSMPLDDLLMPGLELRELDGLHLVKIYDPSPLGLGLLEATVQTLQLGAQKLVVRLSHSGAECSLSHQQGVRPEQGLTELVPHERIQLLSPC